MQVDPREFRHTIGLFATGVTIITVCIDGEVHGMTANAITSVSLDPLLILVCIDRRARMCGMVVEAGRFAINILSEQQEVISRHFAGRPRDDLELRFNDLYGAPALADTLATLVCTVDKVLDGGDHVIVLGRVEALRRAEEIAAPLLYFQGDYRQIAA